MVWISYTCPHRECGYKCNVADEPKLRLAQAGIEDDRNPGYAIFSCPKCRCEVGQCLHCSYARDYARANYRSGNRRNKKRNRMNLEIHMSDHVLSCREDLAKRNNTETNGEPFGDVAEGSADSQELTHGDGDEPWHAYEENDEYVNRLLGTYHSDSVVNELPVSSYSPTYPDDDMVISTFSLRRNLHFLKSVKFLRNKNVLIAMSSSGYVGE